jgi:sugar phosphate isomerase/epimerase
MARFAGWYTLFLAQLSEVRFMKLAFSTNAYLKFSFPEAVRRLAAIGYAGVEIMADVPHAWPACLLEEQKQAIRDSLKQHNLAHELIPVPRNLSSDCGMCVKLYNDIDKALFLFDKMDIAGCYDAEGKKFKEVKSIEYSP